MKLHGDRFAETAEPLLLTIKHLLASEYKAFISEELFRPGFNVKKGSCLQKSDATFSCWNAAISCASCHHLIGSVIQASAPLRRRPLRCKVVLHKVPHKYTLHLRDTARACVQNGKRDAENGEGKCSRIH